METLMVKLAGLDPVQVLQFMNQLQVHVSEVLAANARIKALVTEAERRIDAGEPLTTAEEREALRQRIAENTARIESNNPDA